MALLLDSAVLFFPIHLYIRAFIRTKPVFYLSKYSQHLISPLIWTTSLTFFRIWMHSNCTVSSRINWADLSKLLYMEFDILLKNALEWDKNSTNNIHWIAPSKLNISSSSSVYNVDYPNVGLLRLNQVGRQQ